MKHGFIAAVIIIASVLSGVTAYPKTATEPSPESINGRSPVNPTGVERLLELHREGSVKVARRAP
jgi:hypothetical protein